MKVPLSWLKEYVALDAAPACIADKLTFSGTEVGGIETVGRDYTHIVVGEVLAIEKHPAADRLTVCRVHDGENVLTVVCGASNFTVGDKVPLAKIGAKLANGLTVKRAKLRGQESFGLLCAEDELGLSDDHAGLLLLPRATPAGKPFGEIAGPPDVVFELEITWNRPDCLSIIGVARELAALFDLPLRLPAFTLPEGGVPVEQRATVRIEDAAGCPRYTARVLDGVRLGPSPAWMQRRLTLAGVRPISNVVDITNYVMLECGQPLHAFDRSLLEQGTIVVRRARAGEQLATLDGQSRAITPAMLVIADAGRPVALAGVMGGAGSEIRDTTQDVLLESACFSAPGIRSTTAVLGLATESSRRYERGVDVGNVEWASRRAAALMVELAGATAARGVIDVYPVRPPARRIACDYARTAAKIGVPLAGADIVRRLASLALPVVETTATACTVEVPTFRGDLEREADLVEEVARLHGLDQIDAVLPAVRIVDADDSATHAVYRVRQALIALGLSEALHYSFTSQALLDGYAPAAAGRRVVLPNPVSSDHAVLRDTLAPQMAETLARNLSRQVADAALFELGRVFFKAEDGVVREEQRLCIGLLGRLGRTGMDQRRPLTPDEMFLWLKGLVEAFGRACRLPALRLAPAAVPALEQGWAVTLSLNGAEIGWLGLLAGAQRQRWRMQEPVALAELNLEAVLAATSRQAPLQPLPAYPAIARDIAMVVAEHVSHGDVEAVIRAVAPPELTAVELFDIYRDKRLGGGRKSLAYSLVYRSAERTLTDEEANAFHGAIKAGLRESLKAEIREE